MPRSRVEQVTGDVADRIKDAATYLSYLVLDKLPEKIFGLPDQTNVTQGEYDNDRQ